MAIGDMRDRWVCDVFKGAAGLRSDAVMHIYFKWYNKNNKEVKTMT